MWPHCVCVHLCVHMCVHTQMHAQVREAELLRVEDIRAGLATPCNFFPARTNCRLISSSPSILSSSFLPLFLSSSFPLFPSFLQQLVLFSMWPAWLVCRLAGTLCLTRESLCAEFRGLSQGASPNYSGLHPSGHWGEYDAHSQ